MAASESRNVENVEVFAIRAWLCLALIGFIKSRRDLINRFIKGRGEYFALCFVTLFLFAAVLFPQKTFASCAQADNNWLQARHDASSTGSTACGESFDAEKLGQVWSTDLGAGLVGAPVGMQHTDGNYYIWVLTTAGDVHRIDAETGNILETASYPAAYDLAGPALLPANGIATGGGCVGSSHLIIHSTSGAVKSLDPFSLTTVQWSGALNAGVPWGKSPPLIYNNGTEFIVAFASVPSSGDNGEVKPLRICAGGGAIAPGVYQIDVNHGTIGPMAADSYTNASKIFLPIQHATTPSSAKRFFLDADVVGTFGSSTYTRNGAYGAVYAADLNQFYETHSNRAAALAGTIAAAGTFGSGGNEVLINSIGGTSIGTGLQTPPAYCPSTLCGQSLLYFSNFTQSGGLPNFFVGQETGFGTLSNLGSKTGTAYTTTQSTGWPVMAMDTVNSKKFVFFGTGPGGGNQLMAMDVTTPASIVDNAGKNTLDLGAGQPRGNPMIMEVPLGGGAAVGYVFIGTSNDNLAAFATDIVPPSIVDNGTDSPASFSSSVVFKLQASDIGLGNNLIKTPTGLPAGQGLIQMALIDRATGIQTHNITSSASPAGVTFNATDGTFDEITEPFTITMNLTTFSSLPDGSYTASIYVRDIADNIQISGSAQYPPYQLAFIVDRSLPNISSISLSAGVNSYVPMPPEPNPPCTVQPCVFYSQVGAGSFSARVVAQDVLSGLREITHLALQTGFTTTGTGKVTISAAPFPTTAQTFDETFNFTSSTSFNGDFTVTAKDFLYNNATDTFKVLLDNKPPRITGAVRNGSGGTSHDKNIFNTSLTVNWDAYVDDKTATSDAQGAGTMFTEVGVGATASCADVATIAFTNVGLNTSHTFTGLSLADGTYFVKVRATDRVNNVSTCTAGPALTVDTTVPTLLEFVIADPTPTKAGAHLIQLSFSETMSTSVAVTADVGFGTPPPNNFVVTSSGGVNGWQISGGKQVWMGLITIVDNVLATDGLNSFKFSAAQDDAGNTMVTNTQTGVIDTVDPGVSSVQLNGGAAYATSTTLALTFNGADAAPPTAPASGILQYFYSFNAPTPDTASTTDKTLIPQNGASVNLNVTVPTDGLHTIYVWAEDNAGNVGAAVSDSIQVDTGMPQVTAVVLSTSNGSTTTGGDPLASTETVFVTIDFSEAMDQLVNPGVAFGLATPFASGGVFTANPGWVSATQWQGQLLVAQGTENGLHAMRITGAQDLASNAISTTDTDQAPLRAMFEIDTLAPVVSNVVAEGGAPFTTQPQINFTFTATDGAGSGIVNHYYELDTDSGGQKPVPAGVTSDVGGSPGLLAAANGQHTVYVWAEDRAGNMGLASSDGIFVDLIAPNIQNADVDNPVVNAQQPITNIRFLGPGTLELTVLFSEAMDITVIPLAQVRDPAGNLLNLFFNSQGYTPGTGDAQWRATLLTSQLPQDGQFTAEISGAQDPAGNLIAPGQATFVVDTTAPQFTTARFLTPLGQPLVVDPATNVATYSATTDVGGELLRILDLDVLTDADGQGVGQRNLYYRLDIQYGLNDPLEIGIVQNMPAPQASALVDEIVRLAEDANQVVVTVWADDLLGNAGSDTVGPPFNARVEARVDTEPKVDKPTPASIAADPVLAAVFAANPALGEVVQDSVTAVAPPGVGNVLQNDLLVSDQTQADYETFTQVVLTPGGQTVAIINTEAAGGPSQNAVTLLSLAGEPGEVLYDIRPLTSLDGGLSYFSGAPLAGAAFSLLPDNNLLQQNIITTQWSLSAVPEGLYQVDQRFFDLPARNETSASVLVLVDKTSPATSELSSQQAGAVHNADIAATLTGLFERNPKGATVSPFVFVRSAFFDWQGSLDDRTLNPNIPRGRIVRLEYQFSRTAAPDDTAYRQDLEALPAARSARSHTPCGWRTALPAATVDYCVRGDAANLPGGGGDGAYFLFLRFTDSAGNSSVSSASFVLDNLPPDVIPANLSDGQTITFRDDDIDGSLVEGGGWNRILSGSWSIDDDLARITIYLCPQGTVVGQYGGCQQTLPTTLYDVPGKQFRADAATALPVGLYSAFYEAVDLAGNSFTRRLDFKVSNKVSVDLRKTVNVTEAETGDVVQYQISVSLLSQSEGDSLVEFFLEDAPAQVLKYLPGSARLLYGGQTLRVFDPLDDPAMPGKKMIFELSPTAVNAANPNAALGFSGLDISSSITIPDTTPNKLVLTYYMVVGASRPGLNTYPNTVTYRPKDPTRVEYVTATAQVNLRGKEGVFRDTGLVLGKVFQDANRNGVQDRGEGGFAGVRLYTETGIAVDTGLDGKFSMVGLKPGKHVLKLFPPSVPRGMKSRAGLSQLFDVPRGGMALVDFPLYQ